MQIQSAPFILASDLFKGFDALRDIFTNHCGQLSWGTANRTLVDFGTIYSIIEENTHEEVEALFLEFQKKTEEIEIDMYIDLEN